MGRQLEQAKASMGQTGKDIIRTSSKGEEDGTVPLIGGAEAPSSILKIPSFPDPTSPVTLLFPDETVPPGDKRKQLGPLKGQQGEAKTGSKPSIDRNSNETFLSTINEIRASHCENLEKMQKMYEERMQEMMKNHDREIESLRMTNEALRNMLQDIKAQIAALGGVGGVDANKLEQINKELDSELDICGQDKKLNKICMKIIKTSINCLSLRELRYLHCAVYRAGVKMKPTSIVHSEDINRCCECTGFICCLPSIPKDAEKKFIERINCLENELENANDLLQRLRDRYESKSGCNRRCCTGHSERYLHYVFMYLEILHIL
ncbi:unnamed protein product [Hermetia illucens]|uniref:Uncharacterized protein n=1 Tax=Hermetia illucens TaxID=343691 RepID=A0A7R8UZA3_HERIL|nr:unnamed protein product [Hermetia illucens]